MWSSNHGIQPAHGDLGDAVVAPRQARVEQQGGVVAPREDVVLPLLRHAQQVGDHRHRQL